MSLINCHECNAAVSTEANACPHCGANLQKARFQKQQNHNRKTFILIGFICFVGYAGYNAIGQWNEKRNQKKAEVAEYFRRNNLTPEQRIAEDQAKARRLAYEEQKRQMAAKREADEAQEMKYRAACVPAIKGALHDPGSFQFVANYGRDEADGKRVEYIEGRARNGFGALTIARWQCNIVMINGTPYAASIEQIKP